MSQLTDAFAYCGELVRSADRDRYLASLFAPAERRGALCALYAFDIELVRVREVAREPMPGEIRLQWWDEVIAGERDGEAAASPVAAALLDTIARYRLPRETLRDVVETRRFDLYDDPMTNQAALEDYLRRTTVAMLTLAVGILGDGNDGPAGLDAPSPAGLAAGIAALIAAFPLHASRGQIYLPDELLARHAVPREEILGGVTSPGLASAMTELRATARRHLDAAGNAVAKLPKAAIPAFLPVAVVGAELTRSAGVDPFRPAGLSPWRRQWLIWRAARDPRRITR